MVGTAAVDVNHTDVARIAEIYDHDGFIFPIDVLPRAEAEEVRADLEAAERELADDPKRLALLRAYPDRLLPSFDWLVRNPELIRAASAVLGPDLLVWSSGLFIKEAHSPKIVSWHQDLTYWGLDDAEETTCWVALSPATTDSGCMRFVAGTHTHAQVEHQPILVVDVHEVHGSISLMGPERRVPTPQSPVAAWCSLISTRSSRCA